MNVEQAIREYLPNIVHLSLATCSNNKPWVCEVHFVYDNELNIYFRSKTSRRHSQEILANKHVAGNIVTQHAAKDKVRGVYFEGTAEVLEDANEKEAISQLFCDRLGKSKEKLIADGKLEDGSKFYKITVDTFVLFDNRESSPGKRYELKWK